MLALPFLQGPAVNIRVTSSVFDGECLLVYTATSICVWCDLCAVILFVCMSAFNVCLLVIVGMYMLLCCPACLCGWYVFQCVVIVCVYVYVCLCVCAWVCMCV